jgi:DNA repair protein RecN (Recombination protein N)
MLTHLRIRGFAIIDALELELGPNLTVITGETGAGKSIVVEALGLLLGDRADAAAVRHGAERAELEAEFDLRGSPATLAWLKEQELDDGDGLIVRRVVGADGRSKAAINGRAAPLATLAALGEQLVDLHGQHEHQSLGKREVQLGILDHYAGDGAALALVAERFAAFRALRAEREALAKAHAERESRLELLRFQAGELDALAPEPGEHARLETEHRRYANLGKLVEGGQRALASAWESDEANAYRLLAAALAEVEALADLDPALAPIASALRDAQVQVQDGSAALRRWLDGLELDPGRRDEVESRLTDFTRLARKHRVEPDALAEVRARVGAELATLERSDARLAELDGALAKARAGYEEAALALRAARTKAAATLGKAISQAMQELGMPGGRFALEMAALAPEQGSASGMDAVEFTVSANPGQPLKPMAKVASGGELARIALAVQAIVVEKGSGAIGTLVFDEVDTGVGGGVAEIVGRKLRALARDRQVICVTHLPQVASQGHHHLKVAKQVTGQGKAGATRTTVERLDDKDRVEELARMLGGVEITAKTRAHAREMLERAAD